MEKCGFTQHGLYRDLLTLRLILNERVFPDDQKKINIVPCHKKENKKLIKNYRPTSPVPVLSKVFERLT